MTDSDRYEVLVIGSGEAGKYMAWTMAKTGHRTAVIERKLVGGSCPNVACLPSKNIIHSAKAASLARRGIDGAGDLRGLAASEGKLRHLGLPGAPPRSTLADANEQWQIYQTVFDQVRQKCQTLAVSRTDQKRRFRFKNKLMSLDATVIDLCASVFDWAQFRRTKGAVKLHIRRHIVSLPARIEVHTLHSDRAAQKSPLILRLTNGLCYTNARRIV